jgi:hypothetical protein
VTGVQTCALPISSTLGSGANVIVSAGSTASGNGGQLFLSGGASTSGGSGGTVNIVAGDSALTGSTVGGKVKIQSGTGATGGSIEITSGLGTVTASGSVSIQSADTSSSNVATGNVAMNTGDSVLGSTGDVMGITELSSKFLAFGWDVLEMDGNDFNSIDTVIPQAQSKLGQGKPIVIIMKTEMGQGVDFMMGSHAWHGKAPSQEQFDRAMAQLPETVLGDY